MTLTLSGSSGIVNPQGNQQTPAIGIGTNTAGIYWPNAAVMGFTVNGAEAMRMDQQGNVLIGTTTNVTASKLTVRHFGSNPAALAIGDTNTASSNTGLYFYTTSTANISVGTGGVLTFNTQGGAQENMRISGSGLVGIGTNNPTSPLVVSATSTRNTPLMTIQSLGAFGGGSGYDVGLTINIGAYGSPTSALNIFAGGPSVFYVGTNGNVGISSSTPVVSLDLSQRTDAVLVPNGTTAQRPANPANGMIRFNTTYGVFEIYQSPNWSTFQLAYSVDYLVVAGGGAGGGQVGGAGGAGGAIVGTLAVTVGTGYSVSVGGGGAGGTGQTFSSGNPSSFSSITATGGGYGSGYTAGPAASGGSGGGGSGNNSGGVYAPGNGTAGQGNQGGTGVNGNWAGGGGGGATSAGGNGSVTGGGLGGNGGTGINWQSLGTYYAAGGGGCGNSGATGGVGGTGGSGIGGNGGTNGPGVAATSGATNTGSGGGGTRDTYPSGSGASGIIIVRYAASAQRGSGGTVTNSGGYWYHTFTGNGTFTA